MTTDPGDWAAFIAKMETRKLGRPTAPAPPAAALRNLQRAGTAYQKADEALTAARKKRNTLVREALAAGWTHAQIAEATGLTRGRIGQIAMTETR